jgi:hypothetical protein
MLLRHPGENVANHRLSVPVSPRPLAGASRPGNHLIFPRAFDGRVAGAGSAACLLVPSARGWSETEPARRSTGG